MLPRKVSLHTSSHLTPIEAWWSTVSTTWEGCRVSSEVQLENCTQVLGGWAKFGQHATHGWEKIALHTCSDLFKPVRTCLNQSAIQWPCTLVAQCHLLHFRMLLFFGLMSYPGEIAYFNSPNEELSNGVRVMARYWSKIVGLSRRPCLKTVDRKRFECRYFLVLHAVLLKIAYFNQLIDSFLMTYCPKSCHKEKLSIPLEAHHKA